MKLWKNLLGLFVYATTIFVVGFAISFWWAAGQFAAPGPLNEKIYFEVERGQGLITIAHNLKESGAVENPYIFVFGTRLLNAQSDLKAGEYEIEAGVAPRAIMEKMREGKTYKRRITVPEGLTSFEIEKMIAAINDIKFVKVEIPAEGTLLPGTYDYRRSETNADILGRMSAAMTGAINELWPARAGNLPVATPSEALILASIVEKETGVDSERRRVAGVFVNRLRLGMPLQTDPTVIYAITNGKPQDNGQGPLGRRLLSEDLKIDSPYNTYKYPGLPPGPICNPGKASIEAALNPEIHDYIFFVADGTGGHAFARTLPEHNANVQKWRAIRAQKQ
jgi:UPF0755 protein